MEALGLTPRELIYCMALLTVQTHLLQDTADFAVPQPVGHIGQISEEAHIGHYRGPGVETPVPTEYQPQSLPGLARIGQGIHPVHAHLAMSRG